MSEFTLLFRGRDRSASPDQARQTAQKWVAWFKELGERGQMKDPGHPLDQTGAVIAGSSRVVHDGPFAEAKDVVGGYIVVEATDLQHAVALSKGCPILDVGGSVEVRPVEVLNM
jgi:hypothetical protein